MKPICQNIVKKDSLYPLIKHHVPLCTILNFFVLGLKVGDSDLFEDESRLQRENTCRN